MTLTLQGNGTLNGLTVLGAPVTTLANTGTAASPSLVFDGDSDTGLFRPGANQIALSVGGSARLTIASDGTTTFTNLETSAGSLTFGDYSSTTASSAKIWNNNSYGLYINGTGDSTHTAFAVYKVDATAGYKARIFHDGSAKFAGENFDLASYGALSIMRTDSQPFPLFRWGTTNSYTGGGIYPDGSALFAGSVQAGGNAQSGTAVGTRLNSYGAVHAARTNDSDVTWGGYKVGNNTPTSQITADGSATFLNYVTSNEGFYVSQTDTPAGNSIFKSWKGSDTYVDILDNGTATFGTGTAVKLFGDTGEIRVKSGGGINFDAYATSGSPSSNLLDDYEEGSWTPTGNNNFNGITNAEGYYTKVGKIVTLNFQFNFTGLDDSATYSAVAGVPFQPGDYNSNTGVEATNCIFGTNKLVLIYVNSNSSSLFFETSRPVAGSASTGADFFRGSITYMT